MPLAFPNYEQFYDYSGSAVLERYNLNENNYTEQLDNIVIEDKTEAESEHESETTENSILLNIVNLLRSLNELYTIKDKFKVYDFLASHENLYEPILEAYNYIEKIFVLEYKPRLEIYTDPEENFEIMFIIINTSLPSERLFELLEEVDDLIATAWPKEIRELLGVDVDYELIS